jgi:hypothetical protein
MEMNFFLRADEAFAMENNINAFTIYLLNT